jgi:hypothetical protein
VRLGAWPCLGRLCRGCERPEARAAVARVFRGRGASGDRVSAALGEPSVWGREWSIRTIVAVVVRGSLADGDGGLRGIGGAIIVLVWCGSAGREWPFLGPQWRRCSEAIMHEAGGNKRVGVDCCFLWDPKNRADHGPSSSWSVRSPRRRNNEMVALSLSRPQLTTDAVCPSRHPSSGPVGQVRARNGATRHPIALLGVLPSRMCKHIPRRRLSSVQLVDLGASRSRYYDRHLIVLGRYEGCADSNVVARRMELLKGLV